MVGTSFWSPIAPKVMRLVGVVAMGNLTQLKFMIARGRYEDVITVSKQCSVEIISGISL
jgi:hypothetical protein